MRHLTAGLLLVLLGACQEPGVTPEAPAPLPAEPLPAAPRLEPVQVGPQVTPPPAGWGVLPAPVQVARRPPSGSVLSRLEPGGAFRLDEVREVVLDVALKDVEPGAALVLELASPGGVPYLSQELAFPSGGEQDRLQLSVPVAGTLMQQLDLQGTWTARLLAGERVLATHTFVLSGS